MDWNSLFIIAWRGADYRRLDGLRQLRHSCNHGTQIRLKSKPAILHLNLHRGFFAQIAARTKRIEYRDQTPYWCKRLEGRKYDVIQFRNGYATNAPLMVVEFRGLRRLGKGQSSYYAIRLGRILKIKRWKK
jgi:hypothetical protein